jgi:hypothetical protein
VRRRHQYEPPAPVGTRYQVHTSDGVCEVEETGEQWAPGDRVPDREPNPLLALARNAEHAVSKGIWASSGEERRAAA